MGGFRSISTNVEIMTGTVKVRVQFEMTMG
jgi:hypothetical protein